MKNVIIDIKNSIDGGGISVAQWDQCLTFDLNSDLDLKVISSSSVLGSKLRMEPI